ncbi:Uncharacterized conserved protein [Chromobacterium violaceum]|uniref:Uncharacterized conserved protein n=1 Tax=Chromobacterium violaceum TaxID=536 RepID=A0A447TI57_CHRVL|nr:Uncharacterized conserved protein [Chromobacterium violaceum]
MLTASLHPAFSFADPKRAVEGFAGTLCALEGDEQACLRLEAFARALGGRPFRLALAARPPTTPACRWRPISWWR